MKNRIRIWNTVIFIILYTFVSFAYGEVQLLSPANGSTTHNQPLFSWDSNHSSLFNIIISSDSSMNIILFNITNISSTSYLLNSTLGDNSYYWKIYPDNETSSEINLFLVNMTPTQISLISPDPSLIVNGVTQDFSIGTNINATCRFNTVRAGSNSDANYLSKGQEMTQTGGTIHTSIAGLLYEGINSFFILCNTTRNSQITQEFQLNITRDIESPEIVDISWNDINVNSVGNITVTLNATDVSEILVAQSRFKKWNQDWSTWINMTLINGTAQTGSIYRFSIAEDNWSEHPTADILFQVYLEDSLNQATMNNYTETIQRSENRPNITIISTKIALQDEIINFNITVIDLDNDDIDFSCNDSRITITKTARDKAEVSWIPLNSDVGTHNIAFYIFDGLYNETRTVAFIINNVNDPPSFSYNQELTFMTYVYRIFNFTFNATDPDLNDTLLYLSNSDVFQVSPRTGEMRAFPTDASKGLHEINITVIDKEGLKDSVLAKIDVLYCGDNICSQEYEYCGNCPSDCGICGRQESGAIIIPERNCINREMIIKTVRLVPRATCEITGRIIDEMEVCGNLTNEEIHIEKITNNTYEEIEKIVTDEYGLASFIPTEEGNYRIKLKSQEIYTYFSTRYCYQEKNIQEQTKKEDKIPSPLITKSIEKPEEIIIPKENTPFLILFMIFGIIPILGLSTAYVGGRYYYDLELKKIKKGKIKNSKYIIIIDKYILSYWYLIKRWIDKKILSHDMIKPIKKICIEFISKLNIIFGRTQKQIIDYYNHYMPKPKPKIFPVPFYNVGDGSPKHLAELITLSSVQYLSKDKKAGELIPKIKEIIRSNETSSLVYVAQAISHLGLKVHYSTTKNYQKGDLAVQQIKEILRKGGKFEKKEYLLSELKKKISQKTITIIEIYATDPNTKKPIRNLFQIIGYDKDNIIVNDYLTGQKERKIAMNLLEKAWKNSYYSVIFIAKI